MTARHRPRRRPVALVVLLLALALALATIGGGPAQAQEAGPPSASFRLSSDGGTVPLIVTATNTSTNADRWQWDWGDGGVSTTRDPTHIYVRPGLFVIELEACAGEQCSTETAVVNVTGRDEFDGGAIRSGGTVYGAINAPGDQDR